MILVSSSGFRERKSILDTNLMTNQDGDCDVN